MDGRRGSRVDGKRELAGSDGGVMGCCARRADARSRGQMSAAIAAEVKHGELMLFYVKQVESAHQ